MDFNGKVEGRQQAYFQKFLAKCTTTCYNTAFVNHSNLIGVYQ